MQGDDEMALLVFILLPIILPIIIILFGFKEYKAKSSESSSSKNRKYKYAFITFVVMEILEAIIFFKAGSQEMYALILILMTVLYLLAKNKL